MSKANKKEIPKSVIRKKTINIFIIRKIAEIAMVIAIIFLPYILGYYILGKESAFCGEGQFFDKYSGKWNPQVNICNGHDYIKTWGVGLFWLFITAGAIFLILLWVKWNWNEAEFKAKDKLGYYS